MKLVKRIFAIVCVLAVCAMCAMSVSAASKESNTADYSTTYGTFHGNLYTSRGSSVAASGAYSRCTPKSGSTVYAPKLYALAEMMSWSSGAPLCSADKWQYNAIECYSDTITANTTSYVTVYGYHGVYNSNGSTIKTAGTQTVKV